MPLELSAEWLVQRALGWAEQAPGLVKEVAVSIPIPKAAFDRVMVHSRKLDISAIAIREAIRELEVAKWYLDECMQRAVAVKSDEILKKPEDSQELRCAYQETLR